MNPGVTHSEIRIWVNIRCMESISRKELPKNIINCVNIVFTNIEKLSYFQIYVKTWFETTKSVYMAMHGSPESTEL